MTVWLKLLQDQLQVYVWKIIFHDPQQQNERVINWRNVLNITTSQWKNLSRNLSFNRLIVGFQLENKCSISFLTWFSMEAANLLHGEMMGNNEQKPGPSGHVANKSNGTKKQFFDYFQSCLWNLLNISSKTYKFLAVLCTLTIGVFARDLGLGLAWNKNVWNRLEVVISQTVTR